MAQPGRDPRDELVRYLVGDIPAGVTVLANNMSFEKGVLKKLDLIQNEGEAMNAFAQMSSMDEAEKTAMREALLKYCELDTWVW